MPISRKSESMPKVLASSGIIGTIWRPIDLLRSKMLKRRTKAMVVDTFVPPPREKTGEFLAAFEQIFDFGTIRRRTIKRSLSDFFVLDRDFEAGTKFTQLFFFQLLLLMGDITAFTCLPEP